ncbi:MAG: FG-GAP repeat protein [Alphaproteobacteria bacterium]|nr:FG-GAP repeat protein [Alphaproteobacteria bacterium]
MFKHPLLLVTLLAVACEGTSDKVAPGDDPGVDSAVEDGDGDGFPADQDCDDGDAAVYPGAVEDCGDGVDDDCDGLVDCEDGDCPPRVCGEEGYCDDGEDNDEDGVSDCLDEDCWASEGCSPFPVRVVLTGGRVTRTRGLLRSWVFSSSSDSVRSFTASTARCSLTGQVSGELRIREGQGDAITCGFSAEPSFQVSGTCDCDALPLRHREAFEMRCPVYGSASGFLPPELFGERSGSPEGFSRRSPVGSWYRASATTWGSRFTETQDPSHTYLVTSSTWSGPLIGGSFLVYDRDGDRVGDARDCDDGEARVSPELREWPGDGLDNNCDGVVDVMPLSEAKASFVGSVPEAALGSGVAALADLDGDGLPEIALGAPGEDDEAGAVYIYLSAGGILGERGLDDATLRVSGEAEEAEAGLRLATAGDIDGDGLEDLLIGAPGSGRAYVFHGVTLLGASSLSFDDADVSLQGSGVGGALTGAGDVNGDGIDDLLLGARGSTQPGAAYLLFGGALGEGLLSARSADRGFEGAAASSLGAVGVAGIGDVDGDGLADLLIGEEAERFSERAAHLVLGAAALPSTSSLADADHHFVSSRAVIGVAAAGLGDLDQDGLDDFMLSAPELNVHASQVGENGVTYVVLAADLVGGEQQAEASHAQLQGGYGVQWSGASLAVEDVDGDGRPDAVVGAPQSDAPAFDPGASDNCGEVFVVLGDTLSQGGAIVLEPELGWMWGPAERRSQLGAQLAAAGDVDGDGRGEVLVGAPGHTHFTDERGAAWLIGL